MRVERVTITVSDPDAGTVRECLQQLRDQGHVVPEHGACSIAVDGQHEESPHVAVGRGSRVVVSFDPPKT